MHRAKRGGITLRTVGRRDSRNANGTGQTLDGPGWWRKRGSSRNFYALWREHHAARDDDSSEYDYEQQKNLKGSFHCQ
jgi:hypothetical protein